MENNLMKQFIDILRNDQESAYGFIANNAWQFSKDELSNIIKELLYGVDDHVDKAECRDIMASVADELDDMYSED